MNRSFIKAKRKLRTKHFRRSLINRRTNWCIRKFLSGWFP